MPLGRVIRPGGTVTGRIRGAEGTQSIIDEYALIEEPEGEAIGPEEGPTTEQA